MNGGATDAPLVAGRYRLLRVLGRGGMGVVWLARDELLGREVAVKEIPRLPASEDPEVAALAGRRAFREARVAAQLRHPAIVAVHDVVMHDARPWIVMELIKGRSLAQALERDGPLPEQRTAQIGLHMLDALKVAHRQGILHRDVKPSNIMLEGERTVLTDFGIAQLQGATALTTTGALIGSPEYIAPERILGRDAGPAADLWGLGVALYTAVAGHSPFQRPDTRATLAAVLTTDPGAPSAAERLWPALEGLLRKDPALRLTTERAAALLTPVALAAMTQPLPVVPAAATAPASAERTLAGNRTGHVTPTMHQPAQARTTATPQPPTATDNVKSPTSNPRTVGTGRWRAFAAPLAVLLVVGVSAQLAWRTHHGATPPAYRALARTTTPRSTVPPPPAPTPSNSSSPAAPPAPPGFVSVGNRYGYTLAIPDTWVSTADGVWANHAGVHPAPSISVGVSQYTVDPAATALTELSRGGDGISSNPADRVISVTALPTPPGMKSAAQVEFTTTNSPLLTSTQLSRIINRAIITPSQQAYVLIFNVEADTAAALDRDWSNSQPVLSVILDSFQILD